MMLGGDFSGNNTQNPEDMAGLQFMIIKATEGKTFTNLKLMEYLYAINKNYKSRMYAPYLGYYHYARPENNNPEEEARKFYSTVKPYLPALLAVDVEGDALKVNGLSGWVNRFEDEINRLSGGKGKLILYTSQSYANSNLFHGCKHMPLWVARYRADSYGKVGLFKDVVMWQFTSQPFDCNLWLKKESEWASYAVG